jgi:PAS domain S-box-containing protein
MKITKTDPNLMASLIDKAPIMVIMFDPDLNILQINEAFQNTTGWPIGFFKDAGLLTACFPDPKIHAEAVEFMLQAKPGWSRFQLTCKDGHAIDSIWSHNAISDTVHFCIGIDLTNEVNLIDEKAASITMTDTESRYKAIFQSTGTATLIINADTTIAMANQKAENVTGYSPEQLIGRSWTEFVAAASLEKMRQYHELRRKNSGKTPKNYEVQLVNNIGETRIALLDIGMIPGSTQSVVSILDITSLRTSEKTYQSLFNNIPLGVFRSTSEGKIISANPAMAKIYGYSTVNELLERPAQAFYKDPGVREKIVDILGEKEYIKGFETLEYKKDGTEILISTDYTSEKNASGELIYIDGVVDDITKRKRQEQESLKLLSSLQQSPISIMITDTCGVIEYVNPHFLELTEYSMQEVIGNNPRILKSGNTSKKEYAEIWKTITAGKTWCGEFLNRKKGGELYWEDATLGPILNKEGVITNFIGLKVDITTQKKALTELEDIHHIYQQTIENAWSVPYRRSYQTNSYEYICAAIKGLLVLKSEEVTPEQLEKMVRTLFIIDPDTDITNPMEYIRAFREGKINHFKMDIEFVLDSGESKWVSNFATPLYGDIPGHVIGSMGILQDITDKKKTESKLQYRLQLEEIVSTVSTMFIKTEIETIESDLNEALRIIGEFTGADRSYLFLLSEDGEFINNTNEWCVEGVEPKMATLQNLPTKIFPWWMEKLHKFENIYIPKVKDLPAEAVIEKKALEDQDIKSVLVVPVLFAESLTGFVGLDFVKQAITWKKEDIALLRTIGDIFATTLEHIKVKHEAESIENQLLQSQKMEAIGTLSGGIAHDFNNLLTIIQGHAQLSMITMEESDPHYRDLRQIINASARATDLTRQLLLFSRKQAMEFVPVNLNQTVSNLLKMIKRLIGEDIEIRTELEPELWTIQADEGNVEQVIMNLSVNARDAMSEGGKITIKTENVYLSESEIKLIPESRSGQFIRCSIEDSGYGISPDVIQNIFDPFFSTKEAGKGTGLGLSVVYGIVKKHNGWINAYSEVGTGTIFKIYLPATSQKESEKTEEAISIPIESLRGNGERILLIEDEKGVRLFTSTALRKNGYLPIEADSGKNALAVYEAENGNFDLILSDVVLPDINGYQLIDALVKQGADMPAILCSGYTEEKIIRTIQDRSRFHFIQKPFTLRDIIELVYDCLHKESI